MFIILMGDYMWRQYSTDSWHKNADRICLIGSEQSFALWPDAAAQIKDMCSIYDSTLAYTVSAVAKNFDYTALPHETQVIAGMGRYPQIESSRAGALLPRIL